MGVGPSERFREGSGFADWMDHGTSFILGPLPTLIYSFVKFLHERQDEGLLGCLLREIFLSVWVEKSVGTLDLFLTLEGIISVFHHKIYLLVFEKKKKTTTH